MSSRNCEVIEKIYGFNWAAVGSRREGFEELEAAVAPDFKSRFSDETGGREVDGLMGLRVFGEALEQDFEEFSYEPLSYVDGKDGSVVVTGVIKGIARASKMPLSGEFGHVWHLVDCRAVTVEAFRDVEEAREAAGVS